MPVKISIPLLLGDIMEYGLNMWNNKTVLDWVVQFRILALLILQNVLKICLNQNQKKWQNEKYALVYYWRLISYYRTKLLLI